jgi:hypothetical protein
MFCGFFLCIILRNAEEDNVPIGLLYIDSTLQDAFGVNADGAKRDVLTSDQIALRLAAPALDITRTL